MKIMLRRRKTLAVTVAAMSLLLLAAGAVIPVGLFGGNSTSSAQDTVIQEDMHKAFGNLEVPLGTTVMGDVMASMGEVVIRGTVNGDVKANIGQITVTGDVNGNVRATMGQVTVTGSVSGDVDSSMGEIIIDGQVGGQVEASLGSVRINGLVGQDVRVTLGTLEVRGNVGGSIYSEGKTVRVFGQVDGDIHMPRGIVELGPSARVLGGIFVGEGLVAKQPGAETGTVEVGRQLTRQEVDRLFTGEGRYAVRGLEEFLRQNLRHFGNLPLYLPFRAHYFWSWNRTGMNLAGLVVLFALSAMAYALLPRNLIVIREAVEHRTGSVVLWGLLAAVAGPILIILSALTIIGIPLAIIIALLMGLAWLLGYAGVALFLGYRIRNAGNIQAAAPLGEIALGILLLGILSLIPWVRGLVGMAVFILALGASLYTRLGSVKP